MTASRRRFLAGAGASALALLAACTSSRDGSGGAGPTSTTPASTPDPPAPGGPAPRVLGAPTVLAGGLQVPWGLAQLPDGSYLVGQRPTGAIVRLDPRGGTIEVGSVDVRSTSEGGLLGIAVSPRFAEDRAVFAFACRSDVNEVVRLELVDDRLGSERTIISGIETASIHDGGQLAFGPDGYLYVSTGDAGDPDSAQDLDSLNGKVLRVDAEGRPAPGNPFGQSPVHTFGHRNVQGLAWDGSGRLYATELGPDRADELNGLVAGGNYGWPLLEGDEPRTAGVGGDASFVAPLTTWTPSQASPSGLAFAAGSLWVCALRGEALWQVPLNSDGTVGEPVVHLDGELGRLRSVLATASGTLLLTTSNRDGRGRPRADDDSVLELPVD